MFKQWTEEERKIPFFPVVLELGLNHVNKKPSNNPVLGRVDLITVSVEEAENTPNEAAFIIKSSNSRLENRFAVFKNQSPTMEKGEVKFLRLRGIAGVRWMDEATVPTMASPNFRRVLLRQVPSTKKSDSVPEKIEITAIQEDVVVCINNINRETSLPSEVETNAFPEKIEAPTMPEDIALCSNNINDETVPPSEEENDVDEDATLNALLLFPF